mgnify:CR=1 FL=1
MFLFMASTSSLNFKLYFSILFQLCSQIGVYASNCSLKILSILRVRRYSISGTSGRFEILFHRISGKHVGHP